MLLKFYPSRPGLFAIHDPESKPYSTPTWAGCIERFKQGKTTRWTTTLFGKRGTMASIWPRSKSLNDAKQAAMSNYKLFWQLHQS